MNENKVRGASTSKGSKTLKKKEKPIKKTTSTELPHERIEQCDVELKWSNNLDEEKEIEKVFQYFWEQLVDDIETNEKFSNFPTDNKIDQKVREIQNRIKLNQVILRDANRKMKTIDFKTERENVKKWRDKLYTIVGEGLDHPENLEKIHEQHVKELEALKNKKPDKELFLKSCPGISNFHKTIETTLSMLDMVQKTDEGDYEQAFHDIKQELEFNVIHPPAVILSSDEE